MLCQKGLALATVSCRDPSSDSARFSVIWGSCEVDNVYRSVRGYICRVSVWEKVCSRSVGRRLVGRKERRLILGLSNYGRQII